MLRRILLGTVAVLSSTALIAQAAPRTTSQRPSKSSAMAAITVGTAHPRSTPMRPPVVAAAAAVAAVGAVDSAADPRTVSSPMA